MTAFYMQVWAFFMSSVVITLTYFSSEPGLTLSVQLLQKIQDDEAREIEQAGLADKDAFAELKKMAGEGGAMAHGEGLPQPPSPQNDPAVCAHNTHIDLSLHAATVSCIRTFSYCIMHMHIQAGYDSGAAYRQCYHTEITHVSTLCC